MVPKFISIALSYRGRLSLYALLGSLPRSSSGKTRLFWSAGFLSFGDLVHPSEMNHPMTTPSP